MPGFILKGTKHGRGYRILNFLGVTYQFHRLIWAWHYGDTKNLIDHKDRNKENNRIGNLRKATPSQNSGNSTLNRKNTSGHRGVYKIKNSNSWGASISVNGQRVNLGQSTSKQEMISRYVAAAKKHRGEFYAR